MTCEQLLVAEVRKLFPTAEPIVVTLDETGEGAYLTIGSSLFVYDMANDEDVTNTFRFVLLDDPTCRGHDVIVPMPAGWLEQFARQF